jgi:hypothetical protein
MARTGPRRYGAERADSGNTASPNPAMRTCRTSVHADAVGTSEYSRKMRLPALRECRARCVATPKEDVVKKGFVENIEDLTAGNIKNTGRGPLQAYTIYAPPRHADATVHRTRADADAAKEHFAGKTTE